MSQWACCLCPLPLCALPVSHPFLSFSLSYTAGVPNMRLQLVEVSVWSHLHALGGVLSSGAVVALSPATRFSVRDRLLEEQEHEQVQVLGQGPEPEQQWEEKDRERRTELLRLCLVSGAADDVDGEDAGAVAEHETLSRRPKGSRSSSTSHRGAAKQQGAAPRKKAAAGPARRPPSAAAPASSSSSAPTRIVRQVQHRGKKGVGGAN